MDAAVITIGARSAAADLGNREFEIGCVLLGRELDDGYPQQLQSIEVVGRK